MIEDYTRHTGTLLVSVHIPDAQSLKDKRRVLKSLKDRIRLKFNVSVAQIDTDDKWQTAVMAISMIGNDQRYIDGCLESIIDFIGSTDQLEMTDHHVEYF